MVVIVVYRRIAVKKVDLSKDQSTPITWREMGLPRGEFFSAYKLTSLASFQLLTEDEFAKLFRVGRPLAEAVRHYLESIDRRFRAPDEPFRDRAKALYGSVLKVPSVIAMIAGGFRYHSLLLDLDERWRLHTLGDVARRDPEQLEQDMSAFLDQEPFDDKSFQQRYGADRKRVIPTLIQWLKDQGVW